jgi:hypothetical protein
VAQLDSGQGRCAGRFVLSAQPAVCPDRAQCARYTTLQAEIEAEVYPPAQVWVCLRSALEAVCPFYIGVDDGE